MLPVIKQAEKSIKSPLYNFDDFKLTLHYINISTLYNVKDRVFPVNKHKAMITSEGKNVGLHAFLSHDP